MPKIQAETANGLVETEPPAGKKLVLALEDAGIDIHDLKGKKSASKRDLFKRPNGDICVKPKDGSGPGEGCGAVGGARLPGPGR